MTYTIIYGCPLDFNEFKPGSNPARFIIAAAQRDENGNAMPEVLHIFDGDRPYYIDYERGSIPIPVSAKEVAEAIVADYIRAAMFADGAVHPAIFCTPGEFSKDEVEEDEDLMEEFKRQLESQTLWFKRLAKEADDDWQKNRQHKNISIVHRKAAEWLSLEREWAKEANPNDIVPCVFCTSHISRSAIVCPVCTNVLDKARYEEMTA